MKMKIFLKLRSKFSFYHKFLGEELQILFERYNYFKWKLTIIKLFKIVSCWSNCLRLHEHLIVRRRMHQQILCCSIICKDYKSFVKAWENQLRPFILSGSWIRKHTGSVIPILYASNCYANNFHFWINILL